MKIIAATVKEQNLVITPSVLSVAESVNAYSLKITYDAEWSGADKIVTFKGASGRAFAIKDEGSETGVVIPWEVLRCPGKVTVGVMGYIGSVQKLATTGIYDRNTFIVLPASFGLQEALTPTPDIYQKLLQTIDQINGRIDATNETLVDTARALQGEIGNLTDLSTEAKDNLVAAINELVSGAGSGTVKSVNNVEPDENGNVTLTASNVGAATTTDITTAVGAEANARQQADGALQTAINGKQATLTTAQLSAVNSGIDSTKVGQIETNRQNIATEINDRQGADNNLQGQIDALAASSDVTDIVGTKAELNAYDTSKLKDNDIVKVLQDESQNDETTYYRWSTTTQTFTLIGEEGPYYTKSATDTLLAGKVDKVTGYGLSENNYSDADQTKLACIAAGAEVNVQADWNEADTSSDAYILNKPTIPTVVLYSGTGQNTDGAMTQKAVTDLVGDVESILHTINNGGGN